MNSNTHIQKLRYPEYAHATGVASVVNMAQHLGSEEQLAYTFAQDKKLLQILARQNKVGKDCLLLTAGADAALHHISETFLYKGKMSIIPLPAFGRFEFHTKVTGAQAFFVAHSRFPYSFDLSNITQVAKAKNASVIFIANPNNPTGEMIRKEILLRFVNDNAQSLVVVDEVLIENDTDSIVSYSKNCKNLVVVKSLSKLYKIPGLRIGYMVAHPACIALIGKTVSPFAISSLSIHSARKILMDKKSLQAVKKSMVRARELLKRSVQLPITDTHASVCLVDAGTRKVSLYDYLKKHGILTVDARSFRGLGGVNAVRVVLTDVTNVKKLIKALQEYTNIAE